MSSRRNKWSEFKEIFKKSGSMQAISDLKDNYKSNSLIKFKTKYGKGLLNSSVELDKPEIAEYLMKIGCNKEQINRQDGRSPLALALSSGSEKMVELLCARNIPFIWSIITGHSKKLEFGNEKLAEIFRSEVSERLEMYIPDCDKNFQMLSCQTGEFLHELDWPLEGLSFLRLSDQCMRFAQLYYASDEADAIKVKHCLENDHYSDISLMMALTSRDHYLWVTDFVEILPRVLEWCN